MRCFAPCSAVLTCLVIGLVLASCTTDKPVTNRGMTGQAGEAAGTTGAAGAAGSTGAAGAAAGGSGTTGAAGAAGAAGTPMGAAGTTGGGGAGTTGAAGADGGSAGGQSGGSSGQAGAGVDAGQDGSGVNGFPPKNRTGKKSPGCGKEVMGAGTMTFTNHTISIPACAACTVPNCPRNCIAPPFVPGGVNAQTAANGENFLNRDFTIELPTTYNPDVPTPVFFGADGCGPVAPLKGAGFSVPGENPVIKVGVQQIGACFADGGIRCAPDIKNVGLCVNGPEIPYLLAVQSWVEANFCVDMGQEFFGGGSSGAWESLLAGCGAASSFRGIYTVAGGLREHRWACDGPIAAFLIASEADTLNPVGPLQSLLVIEDTYGMAPARDEILTRNGCVGKNTAPFDPKYPSCVKYTGCPATYPVVWCDFAGGQHDNPTYNNVNYANAIVPFMLGLPPAP
jgi:hypothetical protein